MLLPIPFATKPGKCRSSSCLSNKGRYEPDAGNRFVLFCTVRGLAAYSRRQGQGRDWIERASPAAHCKVSLCGMKTEVGIHSDCSRKFLEQNQKNLLFEFSNVVQVTVVHTVERRYSSRSKIDFEFLFEIDLYVLGSPDPKTSYKVGST